MWSNCLGIPEELHSLHRSQNTSGESSRTAPRCDQADYKTKGAQGQRLWEIQLAFRSGWEAGLRFGGGGGFRIVKIDVDTGEFRKPCTGPGKMHLSEKSQDLQLSAQLLVPRLRVSSAEWWRRTPAQSPSVQLVRSFLWLFMFFFVHLHSWHSRKSLNHSLNMS